MTVQELFENENLPLSSLTNVALNKPEWTQKIHFILRTWERDIDEIQENPQRWLLNMKADLVDMAAEGEI